MTNLERVKKTILCVIDELNEQWPEDERIEKSGETILYGESGRLDSVGLVNLIVAAEEAIEMEFGAPITLADERAMSLESNPFETISSLVDYIAHVLEESGDG